jgi:trehalose 6-phosphate synthase
VSNRGPTSFRLEDGVLTAGPPAGGLASGLRPLVAETGGTWFACAVTDADRIAAAAAQPDPHINVRLIAVDPDQYHNFYDVISNSTLWFLHHGLWNLPVWPEFDSDWHRAWSDYVAVNHRMAVVVAAEAPENALVMVQDYHFMLLGAEVRALRPDLRLAHFSHTPFTGPESLHVLPSKARQQMLEGLAAYDTCGFHTERWRSRFLSCCEEFGVIPPSTFVSPLPADISGIRELATSDDCADRLATLEARIGDQVLLFASGRLELSKNLVRAFNAYELLLETEPWRQGDVVFAAFVYASRGELPEYETYRSLCEETAARINERFGTSSWNPIWLDTDDDLARSVAGLRRYDVLIINPIRDGLNLIAFEGPSVNERDGVLLLSPEAGAFSLLAGPALECPPFDIEATAQQMSRAIALAPEERARRSAELRTISEQRSIDDWLQDNVGALAN